MADAPTIARISGAMLTPGVSGNRRLYTPELIGKAVARMRERIADPTGLPLVMRTHHEAGDNSRLIVGRIADVRVDEDGAAKYKADLFDTAPGRDIATLTAGPDPALRSVSIHGYWLGPVKRIEHAGQTVETADDLEIDAVDFTATPGVLGAVLDAAESGDTRESVAGRTAIHESMDAVLTTVEEFGTAVLEAGYTAAQKKDALAAGQAMKNASGKPAYTIKTKADLRKAIKAVGRGGADHDAIRRHIITRATALGLTAMIPDTWSKDGSMKENATRLGEIREYYGDMPDGSQAGFCIDAYNGPISLTLRACNITPADLRAITAAAMAAACDALAAMDPDMDADIDVPGAPNEDTDNDMESAAVAATAVETVSPAVEATPAAATATPSVAPTNPPADENAGATPEHVEVPAMGETTTAAETASTARTLSDEDIQAMGALFTGALTETLAPLAAALKKKGKRRTSETGNDKNGDSGRAETSETTTQTTAEAAPAATKAELEALKETLLTQLRDELREERLKDGLPSRRGLRASESDEGRSDQQSRDDAWANRGDVLLGDYARTPVPAN